MRFAALLCLALLAGCQVFRPILRDWSNTDLKGQTAPPLAPGSWVLPRELPEPARAAPEGWRPPEVRWRLIVFFLPD